jgi:hypothetical protein
MDYPDGFEDSFLDLREDLAEASSEGKLGLMVLFTTEGCSYREETGDCAAWQGRTVPNGANLRNFLLKLLKIRYLQRQQHKRGADPNAVPGGFCARNRQQCRGSAAEGSGKPLFCNDAGLS